MTLHQALLEALGLKDVARAGWLRAGVRRPESVAGHSWGVAFLVLALAPPDLDLRRALAMAILHDLAEVRTGDLTPADGVDPADKARREREALEALVAPLPDGQRWTALLEELQACGTPEARFVKACDRLDMALQAQRYAQADGIDPTEFIQSALEALDDPELRKLADPNA